jgi:nitrous oxidase accessory protein NosD
VELGLQEEEKMRKAMVVIGILLLAQLAAPALGATWYVSASVAEEGNGKSWLTAFKTVQRGVHASSDGDTVLVATGTYVENPVVGKKITLAGSGKGDCVLDAGGNGVTLTVIAADGVTIRDLIVTNASGDAFGGIFCASSTLSVKSCRIEGNSAMYGGGVFLSEAAAMLTWIIHKK